MNNYYYAIGTTFKKVGRKHTQVETIVDVLFTRNLKGDLVRIRYISEHEFLGQKIKDCDVIHTTVSRGLIENKGKIII